MTLEQFWSTLEGLDPEYATEELTERLEGLSAAELEEFEAHFCRLHRRDYDWLLWGAAYLIDGGCSVRARPNQLFDGFHQSFFCIAHAAHNCTFNQRLLPLTTRYALITKQSTTFLIFFQHVKNGLLRGKSKTEFRAYALK